MKKMTFRSASTTVHLWLGLASGLILFIVCLTGTVYTFRTEIERLLHPSKYYVAAPQGAQRLSADSLVSRLCRELKGKVVSLNIPEDPERSYQVGVRMAVGKGEKKEGALKSAEKRGERAEAQKTKRAEGGGSGPDAGAPARPKTFFVNPYTGAVLGSDGDGSSKFFATTLQMHRWLLMESSGGRIIVGAATLIFLFIILTGLIIWFPVKIKYWKQGLKIRFSASWKRVNHDLHNALGFYSAIFLLVMGLTGLCWSFEWYRNGASAVLGAKVFGSRGEKPLPSVAASGQPQPVSALLATAGSTFTYPGDYRVTLAADSTAIRPFIEEGKCKVFSINSINNESWMHGTMEGRHKVIRHQQFNAYVFDEVVPFIKTHTSPETPIIVCGASFGALHSMNLFLKRPDLINGVLAMSGVYDLTEYSRGYWDDEVYFNSPQHYMPNLTDHGTLEQIRRSQHIHLFSGSGPYEAPDAARSFAGILYSKGINYELGIWGPEWPHDWNTWRYVLPHYLGTRF